MACFSGKNPRELDVSAIIAYLSEFDLEKEDTINNVIIKKKLHGEAILNHSKADLLDILRSVNDEDKIKFFKMRTDLRKADFDQREKLDLEKIDSNLSSDQVCQLFEQVLDPKGKNQRHKWYDYIEEQSITGAVLADPEYKMKDFADKLELNMGQQAAFKKLMGKFQPKPQEGSNVSNITNHGGTFGIQNNSMGTSTITVAGGLNAKE